MKTILRILQERYICGIIFINSLMEKVKQKIYFQKIRSPLILQALVPRFCCGIKLNSSNIKNKEVDKCSRIKQTFSYISKISQNRFLNFETFKKKTWTSFGEEEPNFHQIIILILLIFFVFETNQITEKDFSLCNISLKTSVET